MKRLTTTLIVVDGREIKIRLRRGMVTLTFPPCENHHPNVRHCSACRPRATLTRKLESFGQPVWFWKELTDGYLELRFFVPEPHEPSEFREALFQELQ